VERFEETNLRDEWLVATIALLDRIAATPKPPRQDGWLVSIGAQARPLRRLDSLTGVLEGENLAQMLAAALCVLKLSSAEAELNYSMKDLIFRLAGRRRRDAELWRQIYEAELQMYRLLSFQVANPCVADLSSRVSLNIVAAAKKAGDCAEWPGLVLGRRQSHREKPSTPRFVALSEFFVELAVAHAQEEIYRDSSPPIALALAAVQLAMHAFGSPPATCIAAFEAAEREVRSSEGTACFTYTPLTVALYALWKKPPYESQVVAKWKLREDRGLLVPAPDLKNLNPQLVLPPDLGGCSFLLSEPTESGHVSQAPSEETPLSTPERPARPRSPSPLAEFGNKCKEREQATPENTQAVVVTTTPASLVLASAEKRKTDDIGVISSPPVQLQLGSKDSNSSNVLKPIADSVVATQQIATDGQIGDARGSDATSISPTRQAAEVALQENGTAQEPASSIASTIAAENAQPPLTQDRSIKLADQTPVVEFSADPPALRIVSDVVPKLLENPVQQQAKAPGLANKRRKESDADALRKVHEQMGLVLSSRGAPSAVKHVQQKPPEKRSKAPAPITKQKSISNGNKMERAKRAYEDHYELAPGAATEEEIQSSSEGVEGWAKKASAPAQASFRGAAVRRKAVIVTGAAATQQRKRPMKVPIVEAKEAQAPRTRSSWSPRRDASKVEEKNAVVPEPYLKRSRLPESRKSEDDDTPRMSAAAVQRFGGDYKVYTRSKGLMAKAKVWATGSQVVSLSGRSHYEHMVIMGDGIVSPFKIKADNQEFVLISEVTRTAPPYTTTLCWESTARIKGKVTRTKWIQERETMRVETKKIHGYGVLHSYTEEDRPCDNPEDGLFSPRSSRASASPSMSLDFDNSLDFAACGSHMKRALTPHPSDDDGAASDEKKPKKVVDGEQLKQTSLETTRSAMNPFRVKK
jgi:hypothetical protein